jgi:hypothetical protein
MASESTSAYGRVAFPESVGSPNQVVILSAAKNLESSTPAGRICCVRGPDLSENVVGASLGTPGTPLLDLLLGRETPRYARNDGLGASEAAARSNDCP